MLESLLGKGKGMDDEILKILNEYYKEEWRWFHDTTNQT